MNRFFFVALAIGLVVATVSLRSFTQAAPPADNRNALLDSLKQVSGINPKLSNLRTLLLEAEGSGDSSLVVELFRIAEARSQSKDYDSVFRALHTANELGTVDEQLFRYAQAHEKDAILSRSATLILGRKADAETIKRLAPLQKVKSYGNRIQAAWSYAQRVRNLQLEYEKLADPKMKTLLVLDNFASNWSLITGCPEPTHIDLCSENPQAAWSQRLLGELSAKHPKLVAQCVFDRNDYQADGDETLSPYQTTNTSYRQDIAQFLAEESRTEFVGMLASSAGETENKQDGMGTGVDDMLADEPLVLELRVQFGDQELHHEIGVVESQKFLVVTDLGGDIKLKISGDVGAIVEGVAKVNLFVEHEQQSKEFGPVVNSSGGPKELRLNEYRGGGGGSGFRFLISDVWLRRGEDPVPVLLKALSNRDETSFSAAIYLARLGPKAKGAVEQLVDVLKEPDYCEDDLKYRSLKMLAAKALGAIGEPANESAIPSLMAASSDANGYVRVVASQALWATSKHGKAIPSLIKCLKDDEWGVRQVACVALGDIEETEDAVEANAAIEALASALVDQQSRVRATALLELERFGIRTVDSPYVVDKLKELLDDPDANVRKTTARVLKNLVPGKKLDSKQNAQDADSHPLKYAPAELHAILQQYEPTIDFRYVARDGYASDGCHWRIDLNDDLLQAHIKHFDLKPVSQGRLTEKMLRKFPSVWPDISAAELRWYAWRGNRDDGNLQLWSVMAVDPVASELYFFHQNYDTTP